MDGKPFKCELRSGGQTTGFAGIITRISARGDGDVRVWLGLPKSQTGDRVDADVTLKPSADGQGEVEVDLPEPWLVKEEQELYVEFEKPARTRVFAVGVLGS